ncbi:glycosyltransferase family 4 protein [Verrucomicrobium sp. BvORR034]|uniref:glycosyltransferase family 4 protein n=1 Tax=Verrucomicrobium sp. BvORR034 TaxID=1396418 RepID=UPI002240ECE6|nr:glycosyltransferase family 4 protein [Verrucomicrobium sp. BvORR034]
MENAISSAPFAACTIVSSNYLARAFVLVDSLKAHHPDVDFWMLLIDDHALGPLAQEAVDRRGIHLLRVHEIQLAATEVANFRFIYDLTEVATAYKPWTMETVTRLSGRHVFYIDPDIEFFQPLTSLVDAVEAHELVLTPHVLHPMQREGCQPSEADIMGSGIYNLGFLGMNRAAASKVTGWWCERLLRECYSAPEEQRFTDQRWIDFAPCFFDCHISKDETFNVAYWNVDQRQVTLENGTYFVNNRQLSFFHYSGLDEKVPHLLTRHHQGRPRVLLSEHEALTELTRSYIRAVHLAEQECADTTAEYPFLRFAGGERISRSLRRIFLKELVKAEKEHRVPPPSPFAPGGEEPFFDWLNEPCFSTSQTPMLPRLALLLREARQDLIATFRDPQGRDAVRLIEWIRQQGVKQFMLPSRLIPPPIFPPPRRTEPKLVPGLEIVGYLRTESGVGQAARLVAQGLSESSIPFETLVDSTPPGRQQALHEHQKKGVLGEEEAFDCCLLCVNADSVSSVRQRLGREYFHKRRVAGLWFWELETFPESMHSAFQEVDEVWVASEFIRKALAPISPVPVQYIPLPFGTAGAVGALDRKLLGIPEGFFFLFSFDFHSIFRRKNPLAVVEAFKQAFRPGEGPALVLKCINGDSHIADLEQLRYAARDRAEIRILSGYMDYATNQALKAGCGCYVSLHRSEGLGLTMAEAMRQGKPVIATGYSGNMDFMNEGNSFLCRYDKVPVGPGSAPYPAKAVWAEPSISHAAELMRRVYDHPEEAAEKGRRAAADLAERFNPARCAAAVEIRLRELRSLEPHAGRSLPLSAMHSTKLSSPVKTLQKHLKRSVDVAKTVPSFGSLLFQGPQKILQKMLMRLEKQRKPFDEAVVVAVSSHDQRLLDLERSLAELRVQNSSLNRPQ